MRKVLLVLLILLAGGVLAADRIGVLVVQDRIGKQVAAEYQLTSQPDVKIHGFPFLTQAVGGEYDQIDVGLGDLTRQGVTLQDVKIELHGVKAPLSEVTNGERRNVVARTAIGSVVLPYDLIKRYAPRQVTGIAPRGQNLQVDLTGALAGVPLTGTAIVSLKATAEGIRVTPQSIGAGGLQLPVGTLSWTVPVRDLPVGTRISDVEVTSDGVRVSATAQNVNLNDLNKSTQS